MNFSRFVSRHTKIIHKYFNTVHFTPSLRQCSSKKVLDQAYQPSKVEGRQRENVLSVPQSQPGNQQTFSMIFPPPNVTGYIHLGHCLTATIQDVIARQRRKLGEQVIWIPGTDHAGIATQTVVEKALFKEKGVSRHELGRENFLEEVWKWQQQRTSKTRNDLTRLGASLSWDLEYFTMDNKHSWAVREAFIRLFSKNLIYRKDALVNWSCALESTISDIEVENVEIETPRELEVPGYKKKVTFGQIYDIVYRTTDGRDLVVSTTRPETLLGDSAIAVHPEDPRYSTFLGTKVQHPFRNEEIPVIFDEFVSREFGSGAVKITPAHDKNDFEVGKRHDLRFISVINEKGHICEGFEGFSGLLRFEAREKILTELSNRGLLQRARPHRMSVPVCSRSKDVIEFLVRPQWFLRCKEMALKASEAVSNGRIKIEPDNFVREWERWLDGRDWCISRQLWWGHRIPAFLCQHRETKEKKFVAGHSVGEVRSLEKLGPDWEIFQDEDVLDTWFSSCLLPFSLLGWPNTDTLRYPLSLMETGHDILFFWVARMAMLGLELAGDVPFRKVLLHGIICDSQGRKMSKSLGNVISPEHVIEGISLEDLQEEARKAFLLGTLSKEELERSKKSQKKMFPKGIPECGSDALRFTLCSHNIKSHFINLDIAACHANKLFFNKIWQATRYTLGFCEKQGLDMRNLSLESSENLSKMDLWILSKLANVEEVVRNGINSYDFYLATAALKSFFYQNMCDVYLETTKRHQGLKAGELCCRVLATCLSRGLDLMEVFTPFLAQDLKGVLPVATSDLAKFKDPELELEIESILEVCFAVRQQKSEQNITKRHNPVLVIRSNNEESVRLLTEFKQEIAGLTFSTEVLIDGQFPGKPNIKSTGGALCSFEVFAEKDKADVEKVAKINLKKLGKLVAEQEKLVKWIDSKRFKENESDEVKKKVAERIELIQVEIRNIRSITE